MGQCSWLTCRGETDAQRELIRENNFQEEPNSHIQKLDYLSHKPNWFASPPLDTIPINVVSSDKLTAERAKSIQNLLYLDHLTETENTVITELISQHQDLFVLNGEALGATNAIFHQINTIDDVPVFKRQYRFPPIHKDEIIKQCTELEARGIIKPSDSPYSSPIWIVPKKEDSLGNKRWRMVIDYRSLNEKTIGDAYPLPNINEILDQLGNAQYFSSFDLASGFHQIPIHPNDTHKTAFSTPYQHYEFTRMPFGLKNAPPTFQRMMDKVLIGLQGKELFVYMDDIVIYSQTLEEHVRKFQNLSERLRKAGLQLEPDKCHFLKKEINYLGHIISSDGVRPEPKKLTAVQNFPRPTNQKNIRQFLGLTGYYRRFIPNYAKIAKPLTSLLMKDKKFQWGDEENKAFSNLRNALCKSPILQYPDFTKEFVITTDACGYGIAGILSQGEIGKDLPIAYISRVLGKSEKNYSTIEKEMLAIIYAVNYFRPYVYGRKFTLVTDHRPLTWINSVSSPNSRIVRWRLSMQDFDYRIVYKPGLVNANADALSRNIPFNNETECDNDDTLLDIKRIFTIDSDTSSSDSIFTAPAKRKKKEVTKALTKRSRVGSDDIDIAVDNSTKSEDSENVGRNKRSNIADEDITQQTGSSSATEILAEHPASEPLISPEGNDSDNEHNHSELSSNGGLAESERSSESYPASVANNQDIDPSHYLPPAACDELDETFFDDGSLGLADFTEIMSDMFISPEDAQDNNSTDILRTDSISNHENEAVEVDVPDSDDSSDSSEEIFPTARVPFENQRQRENKERLPPNSRIISDQVIECRDNLAMRQDNYLIFTSIRGEACDNGALEILHTIDCPINDLTLLRVKVIPYKKKLTLILPLRNNRNNIVVEEDIREGLQSVHNAIIDLNIKSISIAKTDQFDDVPWNIIEQILVDTFAPIDVKITICTQEVIIPNEHDRSEILLEYHASATNGHKGTTKTFNRLRQNFFWPSMRQDVIELIRNCRACQLKKLVRVKTKQPMVITDTPKAAFDKIAMDMVGPLSKTKNDNIYILTIQDLLTKYSLAIPLKNGDSREIAIALVKNFICYFGAPKIILTDQGSNFISCLMKTIAKKFRIKQYHTTAYRPQSNGSIERSHHVLIQYLKQYADTHTDWDELCELASFAYNTSVHEGTGYTPHQLVFGKLARLPSSQAANEPIEPTYGDYLRQLFTRISKFQETAGQNLHQAKLKSKEYYDAKINPQQLSVGNKVFLLKEPNKGKMTDQYEGPYNIIEILENCNVIINRNGAKKKVHINKLRLSKMQVSLITT
ncbi:uncharacterized protein LOC135172231 [Diachasmimorpha longicaudata]|uniref:uncharacterized protein LOC135172231 n=1 Tax=Diachasmimorpha longicaudata TaxID=58733 RepID=UPI0030B8C6A6